MASKPKIVVTGVGYSGTTFVIRLAKELGWDIGEPQLHGRDERKGMEWEPFWKFSVQVSRYLGRQYEPVQRWWSRTLIENRDIIREAVKSDIDQMPFPSIVKCPDYGQMEFVDLLQPELIIVCHRKLEDVAKSMKSDNIYALQNLSLQEVYDGVALAYGHLMDAVQNSGIDARIVSFPHMALDSEYAAKALAEPLKTDKETFLKAWGTVANPEWVHYR